MAKTKDATKILTRHFGDDREMQFLIEEERLHAKVARMVYDLRTQAGLTQKELADLIGTKQPTIARLEDADYTGHSLNMVLRICFVLGRDLEISAAPNSPRRGVESLRAGVAR